MRFLTEDVMQHVITVQKLSENAVEFQGVILPTQRFLSGMVRSGFDAWHTERMLTQLRRGGFWFLTLSRSQVRKISAKAWDNVV